VRLVQAAVRCRRRWGGGCRWGRCGGVVVKRPAGPRVSCQPPSWIARWWARHSRARLARLVGPPSSQCWRWWPSHQARGRWPSGKPQPLSRTARALRWVGVMTRLARPRSRGWRGGAAEDWGQPGQGGLEPVGQAPLAMGVLPGLGAVVVAGLAAMVLGGVAADQDPGQGPVTGQPVTGLGFQGPGPAALTPKGGLVAEQAVQIDGDQTLGRTPPVWGSWPPSRVRRASSARASARR
jgi:hypothetical protein